MQRALWGRGVATESVSPSRAAGGSPRSDSRGGAARRRAPRQRLLEDEGQLHPHGVFGDLALLDFHFLVHHPGAGDVLQRLGRLGDALLEGVVEALFGTRRHFDGFCDAHDDSLRLNMRVCTSDYQLACGIQARSTVRKGYFIAERSLTVSPATTNTPLPRWCSVCGSLTAVSTHA